MFNVIICDDNKNDLDKVYKVVSNFMDKNKIKYNKYLFQDYNDRFMEIVNRRIPFKIYILDIETPSRSGIDIAREIRKKDVNSSIVFLTGHNDLGLELLKEDIPFTSFINKFVNYEKRLKTCLRNSIKLMHQNRVLKIQEGSVLYTINLDDILYITKDSVDRKTVIITDYDEFRVSKSLISIKELLDDTFVQTHRACVINKIRAPKIDFSKKLIQFDNNVKIDLISNKYRSEVVE